MGGAEAAESRQGWCQIPFAFPLAFRNDALKGAAPSHETAACNAFGSTRRSDAVEVWARRTAGTVRGGRIAGQGSAGCGVERLDDVRNGFAEENEFEVRFARDGWKSATFSRTFSAIPFGFKTEIEKLFLHSKRETARRVMTPWHEPGDSGERGHFAGLECHGVCVRSVGLDRVEEEQSRMSVLRGAFGGGLAFGR